MDPLIEGCSFVTSRFDTPLLSKFYSATVDSSQKLYVNNAIIGASREHPLMNIMLRDLYTHIPLMMGATMPYTFRVLKLAGPGYFSHYVETYEGVFSLRVLPRKVLEARSEIDADPDITVAIHRSESSWLPYFSPLLKVTNMMSTVQQRAAVGIIISTVLGALLFAFFMFGKWALWGEKTLLHSQVESLQEQLERHQTNAQLKESGSNSHTSSVVRRKHPKK